jgi:hypothetical protein
MAKTETWFVRLTMHGFDKANNLMKAFGYSGRDTLAEDAMSVLAAAKSGATLPDCIDAARRRYQKIIVQNMEKELANAATGSTQHRGESNSHGKPSLSPTSVDAGHADPQPDNRR